MIGALQSLGKLPAALALAVTGLAGVVAVQLNQAEDVPPPALARAGAPAEAAAPDPPEPYLPRPIESYGGIAERPLFSPSRRPSPTGGGAAGRSGHDSLMLAGVILTTSKRLAMLESKRATGGVVVVREGQVVEGWSVDSIATDRVVISHNGEVVELLLDDKLKAPRKEVKRTPQTAKPAPAPAAPAANEGSRGGAEGEAPGDEEPVEDPEGAG
ncbi:MAG: hypothetical protein U0S49_07520 [Rhodospirillales bacterium]|nr:hypothetical protein [Rhodospirillales bacterium]